jgi:AhpD family alkylhydroperoxidase
MANDVRGMLNELNEGFATMGKADFSRMQAFIKFIRLVEAPGALDRKTKQLIALGIGICARCQYCIVYHTNEALKAGATRDELRETAFVASLMGGAPAIDCSCTLAQDSINTFAPDYEK